MNIPGFSAGVSVYRSGNTYQAAYGTVASNASAAAIRSHLRPSGDSAELYRPRRHTTPLLFPPQHMLPLVPYSPALDPSWSHELCFNLTYTLCLARGLDPNTCENLAKRICDEPSPASHECQIAGTEPEAYESVANACEANEKCCTYNSRVVCCPDGGKCCNTDLVPYCCGPGQQCCSHGSTGGCCAPPSVCSPGAAGCVWP
jgi:hypothetical protein